MNGGKGNYCSVVTYLLKVKGNVKANEEQNTEIKKE